MKILSREQISKMSRTQLLNEVYPNASKHCSDVSEKHNFVVSDTFEAVKKHLSGDFFDFIHHLLSVGNRQAVYSIKGTFNNPDIEVHVFNGEALYPLAKGTFNGVSYQVRATSLNKYNQDQYLIDIL